MSFLFIQMCREVGQKKAPTGPYGRENHSLREERMMDQVNAHSGDEANNVTSEMGEVRGVTVLQLDEFEWREGWSVVVRWKIEVGH